MAGSAIAQAAPSATAAPAVERSRATIAWDPAIRRGVLANGLRYAVMRNANPTGGVSIRLAMDVGSFEETDPERGAAHLVEHLAFGRTDAGPGGDLEAVFTRAGVAFGRDRNAETELYSTTYKIDLPHADDQAEALAFRWLRTVADGANFSDAAVDRERGVVEAERRQALTAQKASTEAFRSFQAPGMRALARDPIGTPESLAAMTPERLRAFYARWYRPGAAVVVAVGDEPVEALQRRIEEAFASWRPAPTPDRATPDHVNDQRGLEVLTLAEPNWITSGSVCRVRQGADPRRSDDLARLRDDVRTSLWLRILKARLDALAQAPKAPFLAAFVGEDTSARGMASACVGWSAPHDDWRSGLLAMQAQVRLLHDTAPSEAELEAAIKAERATRRGEASGAGTRASPDLAAEIAAKELDHRVTPSPAEAFRAFDAAVADTTPADVEAAFQRDWSGAGPLIMISAPVAPAKSEVMAALAGPAGAATSDMAPATASTAWAYGDFGKAGKVVSRETLTRPDRVRVTFANGVILSLMRTEFQQDQAQVGVMFGAGRDEIPGAKLLTAQLGTLIFKQTGLGRHDFARISALNAERTWGADLTLADHEFLLRGPATGSQLDPELQLLAAYVSDPGFRSVDPALEAVTDAIYRIYRSRPDLVLAMGLDDALWPGSPISLPPRAELTKLTTADIRAVLRPPLTEAPLQVAIVGDFNIEDAIRGVAATFGALPPRAANPRALPDPWFLRFPDRQIAPISVTHDGAPERAMVGAVWPLYVATRARRREEYAIDLLADALSAALRHRLRDELGKTYAPGAEARLPDGADQGLLLALVETSPTDIDLARTEIAAVAARFAKGDVTDAEIEAVRAPRLASISAQSRTNAWWLPALAASGRDPGDLNDLVIQRDLFASITPNEVRKAAADWLTRAPFVVIARPAKAATGAAP